MFLKAQYIKYYLQLLVEPFLQALPRWRRKCIRSKRCATCPSSSISSKDENKKRGLSHRVCRCNAAILSAQKENEERGNPKGPFSPSCFSPPPFQDTQQDT